MEAVKTTFDALVGITGYPIPRRSAEAVALRRGLDLDAEPTSEGMAGKVFRLCEADLLMWLFRAPNVSQGGQAYNFTDEQRRDFRRRAMKIYSDLGDMGDAAGSGVVYGYKGTSL